MKPYLLDLAINTEFCEHCERAFSLLATSMDLSEADYCPFCGVDRYGYGYGITTECKPKDTDIF